MRTLMMPSSCIFKQSKAELSEAVSTIPDMPLEVRKNGSVAEEFFWPAGAMLLVKCTLKWEVFRLGAILADREIPAHQTAKRLRLECKLSKREKQSF